MEDYRKPLTVEFYESICLPQGVFRHTSIGTEILHLDTFYCESHHNSIVVLVNRRLVSSACSSQADVRQGMCGDVEVGSKNVRWKRQREIGVLFGISKLWDSPPMCLWRSRTWILHYLTQIFTVLIPGPKHLNTATASFSSRQPPFPLSTPGQIVFFRNRCLFRILFSGRVQISALSVQSIDCFTSVSAF